MGRQSILVLADGPSGSILAAGHQAIDEAELHPGSFANADWGSWPSAASWD